MIDPIQQKIAEHHEGAISVKAGPGSGKTRTVSERVISLMQKGVDPSKIMVITFTREAAREVRERIETAYPRSGVWVSTIHSLGYGLIQQVLGSVKLLPEDAAYEHYFRACKKTGYAPGKEGYLSLTNARAGHPGYWCRDLLREYSRSLADARAIDYHDLIGVPLRLAQAKGSRWKRYWQSRWEYVTVDEAHDCTRAEADFIQMLSPQNLCMIFDENQSIYRWRGGDPWYMAGMRPMVEYQMKTSYRCPQLVYDLAWNVIANQTVQEKMECISQKGGIELVRGDTTALPELVKGRSGCMILCRTEQNVRDVLSQLREHDIMVNERPGVFDGYEGDVIHAYAALVMGDESQWSYVLKHPYQDRTAALEREVKRGYNKPGFHLLLERWRTLTEKIDPLSTDVITDILSHHKGQTEAFLKFLRKVRMSSDSVRVMTMHASKGLESKHVILYNMAVGMMPHRKSNDIESERRLLYVGLTRAKEDLSIVIPEGRRLSPFLKSLEA